MFSFTEYTPELDFVEKFQNLAEMLVEDNYQNMKNLNYSNYNFNQIFTQLKGSIKQVVNSYRELANRTIQLENQLAKIDPFNLLLLEKTKIDINFGEEATRLSAFAPQPYRKMDSFVRKPDNRVEGSSYKKPKSSNERILIREQFDLIQQFIQSNLRESLASDPAKEKTIHKNVIMNLYVRWNELRGRKILATKQKMIKTKITQQLKKLFPFMDHNENRYRGIHFKEDIVNQTTPTEVEVFTPEQIPELQIQPYEPYQGQDFNFSFQDVYQQEIM